MQSIFKQGNGALEVAQKLDSSVHTVTNQMRAIYKKLGASGWAQALHRAFKLSIPG